jgi:hypothetical protein
VVDFWPDGRCFCYMIEDCNNCNPVKNCTYCSREGKPECPTPAPTPDCPPCPAPAPKGPTAKPTPAPTSHPTSPDSPKCCYGSCDGGNCPVNDYCGKNETRCEECGGNWCDPKHTPAPTPSVPGKCCYGLCATCKDRDAPPDNCQVNATVCEGASIGCKGNWCPDQIVEFI